MAHGGKRAGAGRKPLLSESDRLFNIGTAVENEYQRRVKAQRERLHESTPEAQEARRHQRRVGEIANRFEHSGPRSRKKVLVHLWRPSGALDKLGRVGSYPPKERLTDAETNDIINGIASLFGLTPRNVREYWVDYRKWLKEERRQRGEDGQPLTMLDALRRQKAKRMKPKGACAYLDNNIVSAILDSEQFRSTPRTCGRFRGILSLL